MDFKLANKIEIAAGLINHGKVIIVPTDTVYGLAAGLFNQSAHKKIYEIKQRPLSLPLIALIASPESLYDLVAEIPQNAMSLIGRFWPGGLTIVFKKKADLAVNPQFDTIGVRWSDNGIINHLIEECDQPLVVTSANLSGQRAPVSVEEIEPPVIAAVDFILDGGKTPLTRESTVVDVTEANRIKIIRRGTIAESAIFLRKES